jgi:serine/threonine protein kinase
MKIPANLRWKAAGTTLGEGGQACVHLVCDKNAEFQGEWALKALKRTARGPAYERFSREVSAIQKLDHPYIIRVVDASSPEDTFQFYVMEHIEGAVTLAELIETSEANPFYANPSKALKLFEQICQALLRCHSPPTTVIHRDLSPNNILICPDETPRLIDFGVCQIETREIITLVDEGVGTANYMAPECESGSKESIRAGADLYSAGKILWSAIAGRKAFSRENLVFNGESMPDLFPDDPSAWHLFHIFEKTIRKDWRDRWGSAKDAILAARRVQNLIHCRYPPLERLRCICPACGAGRLESIEGSHAFLGGMNRSRGISVSQCTYCGFCFPVNYKLIRNTLESRRKLD